MAQYSYDEPTNREDLTDVITNISPKETPITTMIGKTKAKATYHEFPEDELADAAENAHVEGEKDTAAAAPARTRKGNHTQIMKRGYSVTNTQQAVDKARHYHADDRHGGLQDRGAQVRWHPWPRYDE